MQADNGSYVYLMPGYQTGYSSYFPVNTPGIDVQYQVYPPGSVFQQPIGSPGYISPYGELLPSTYSWDSSFTTQDVAQGNRYNELASKPSGRSIFSLQSRTGSGIVSKSVPSSNASNSSEVKGSPPILDVSSTHVKRSQPKQANKVTLLPPFGFNYCFCPNYLFVPVYLSLSKFNATLTIIFFRYMLTFQF